MTRWFELDDPSAVDIDLSLFCSGCGGELTDEVNWCRDCGTRWSQNREQIARVHDLFMQKLAAEYPDHPWLALNITK